MVEILNHKELHIIWVDENIFNTENMLNLRQIGFNINNNIINPYYQQSYMNINAPNNNINIPFITKAFQDIQSSINYLKQDGHFKPRFQETIIIVSGNYFKNFVKEFHKNLKDIYIIPKFIS